MVDTNIDTEFATGLTGTVAAGSRVYPLTFPQGATFPAVTYQRISAPREAAFNRAVGSVRTHFQVDGWAESYSAMRQLAVQLATKVLAFVGSSVNVMSVSIENERDTREPGSGLFRTTFDVVVLHG